MPQQRRRVPYHRREHEPNELKVMVQFANRTWRLMCEDEPQRSVRIIPTPPMMMTDLCNFTVPELDAFERFMNDAVARARPICEELDATAAAGAAAGDNRYPRLYRPVPVYVEY